MFQVQFTPVKAITFAQVAAREAEVWWVPMWSGALANKLAALAPM